MQEEIAEEKKKIRLMQQELDEVKAATKEYEMKWKQEIKAKEEAIALAEEERRLKEAAKVNANRRHEALRRKREIDFQRLKDDVQRLEEELARLKASAGLNSLIAPSANASRTADAADIKNLKEPNMKALPGLKKQQESSNKLNRSRACIICKKDEVSVVFLPCSHQVVCGSCNEEHEKEGKSSCPCCSVRIEERIRVYGASS